MATKKKATKKAAAKKAKSSLGPVARNFISQHLRPEGKKGWFTFVGRSEPVYGEDNAIDALVEQARGEDATPAVERIVQRAQLAQKVVDLAEQEYKDGEIAEELGITTVTANVFRNYANAEPIRWTDQDDLAAQVVALRDDGHAWPEINTRAGVSQAFVRKLYTDSTGLDHRRDGGEAESKPAKKKPAKKASTKKPAAKKASTKKAPPKKVKKPVAKKAAKKRKPTKSE